MFHQCEDCKNIVHPKVGRHDDRPMAECAVVEEEVVLPLRAEVQRERVAALHPAGGHTLEAAARVASKRKGELLLAVRIRVAGLDPRAGEAEPVVGRRAPRRDRA